jgi:hypothetical protein
LLKKKQKAKVCAPSLLEKKKRGIHRNCKLNIKNDIYIHDIGVNQEHVYQVAHIVRQDAERACQKF